MKILLTDKRGHTLHEFDDAKLSTAEAATSIIFHDRKYFQFDHTVKGGGAVSFSEARLIDINLKLRSRPSQQEQDDDRYGR